MTATPKSALDSECFFIAPIGKDDSSERKRSDAVLKFVVARAAAELDLTTVRADQIGEPGQITIQVIDHILGARAAVADLTGANANVYYELAVRHTAKLPVALIAEKDCKLPFDIAQMRTIFFDHTDLASADSCREQIATQLREALSDKAAVDSPIATSIDLRALQGGDKVERNVAELVAAVDELAKTQRRTSGQLEHIGMVIADMTPLYEDRALTPIYMQLEGVARTLRVVAEKNNEDSQLLEVLKHLDQVLSYLGDRRRRLDAGARGFDRARRDIEPGQNPAASM